MLCHESPFSVLNPPLAAMFSPPNLAHESVSDPKVPRRGRSLQCPWPRPENHDEKHGCHIAHINSQSPPKAINSMGK